VVHGSLRTRRGHPMMTSAAKLLRLLRSTDEPRLLITQKSGRSVRTHQSNFSIY